MANNVHLIDHAWLYRKPHFPENRALFVKGPRFSRQVGITPIMEAEQMRQRHITTTQIYDKRRRSVRDSASHKVPI